MSLDGKVFMTMRDNRVFHRPLKYSYTESLYGHDYDYIRVGVKEARDEWDDIGKEVRAG